MKMRTRKVQRKKAEPTQICLWKRIVSGTLLASGLSIVLIVLYALILYMGWANADSISIGNTLIKIIGAAFAAIMVERGMCKNRWLIGALTGICYIVVAFFIFSILAGEFALNMCFVYDLGMGALTGALAGIISGMFKK